MWEKLTAKRVILIVIGLTALFFIDDALLVYLVRELDLFSVGSGWYYVSWLLLFIGSVGLAFAVLSAMRGQPTTGAEGMTNLYGTVVGAIHDVYRVRVRGEIWNAMSDEKLKKGDTVIIEKVDGLILFVKKAE